MARAVDDEMNFRNDVRRTRVSAKGWIVIPREIRRTMDIKPGDLLDVIDPNHPGKNGFVVEKRVGRLATYLEMFEPNGARLVGQAKVSDKGWIIIPASLRREIGIEPGDELELSRMGYGEISISKPIDDFMDYADRYLRTGGYSLEDIIRWKDEERRFENERDERRWQALVAQAETDYSIRKEPERITIRDSADE